MASTERSYLALTPIDGPCLELGVTLQPFVLDPDVRALGTLKGPTALPQAGTVYLDALTLALFSVWGEGEDRQISQIGTLDKEIYGSLALRRIRRADTVTVYYPNRDARDVMARCLAGDDAARDRITAELVAENATVVRPADLKRAILAGMREISRLNTALLAPAVEGVTTERYRPALTVPAEELWTLHRLFGDLSVYATHMAEAA
jgi:hypothetical protein